MNERRLLMRSFFIYNLVRKEGECIVKKVFYDTIF